MNTYSGTATEKFESGLDKVHGKDWQRLLVRGNSQGSSDSDGA